MQDLKPFSNLPPLDEADTRPVFCQECEQWFQPNAEWRCPCGERAASAVQPGECGDCGRLGLALRTGHRLRTLCRCLDTPAQRAMCEERWAELERIEREEAELAARQAQPKARQAAKAPGLAEDAPVRDWWPGLVELLPATLNRGEVFDRVTLMREVFTLDSVVSALRRILERIKRSGKQVGSPAYLQTALERELETTGRRLPPEMVEV